MKILHTVESYFPSVGGMQEVVKQLSERLVLMGHEVTVAARKDPKRKSLNVNGVRIEEFDCSGFGARAITGETEKYQEFLRNGDFDVVTNFAAQNWSTDLCIRILPQIRAKKVFVPTGFSMLNNPVFADYYEKMKTWMTEYDMNVFLSDDYRDINFARQHGIKNIMLIPNGADEREFLKKPGIDIRKKLGIPSDAFFILHVGTFTGFKGQPEALAIYLNSSIRDGYLLLCGNDFEELKKNMRFRLRWSLLKLKNAFKRKKFAVKFLSREETVAAYQAADMFLFPSNIECSPIVLFECMAAKLPWLVTDVGNSVEITGWSNGGQVMPTTFDQFGYSHAKIGESATMLDEMYIRKEGREQYAANGFAAWRSRFTWGIIARKYEALYHSLVNKS